MAPGQGDSVQALGRHRGRHGFELRRPATLKAEHPNVPNQTPRPPVPPRSSCWRMGALFWGRGFGANSDGRVGELCFNTGHERVSGDADRRRPMPGRSSPSPSRISAMSAPMLATWRRSTRPRFGPGREAGHHRGRPIGDPPSRWRLGYGRRACRALPAIDTRALTLAHPRWWAADRSDRLPGKMGNSTSPALQAKAQAWPGLEGMDLAKSGVLHPEL